MIDIFSLYSRLQIFCPKLSFLAKHSVYKISVIMLIISFVMNIPINMSRQTIAKSFKINSNETLILETFGKIMK